MEDFEVEDLKQLLTFYRQKTSDLEFQLLQSQLKINRLVANQAAPIPATKTTKTKTE